MGFSGTFDKTLVRVLGAFLQKIRLVLFFPDFSFPLAKSHEECIERFRGQVSCRLDFWHKLDKHTKHIFISFDRRAAQVFRIRAKTYVVLKMCFENFAHTSCGLADLTFQTLELNECRARKV